MSFPSLDEEKSGLMPNKLTQHGSQKQILNLGQVSSYQNQQAATQLQSSSSSYQFPLQALGQGLTTGTDKTHLVSSHGVGSKRHTTLRNKDTSAYALTNLKSSDVQIPGTSQSPHYLNKENTTSGPLPKPHVKIIDLQHNLLPLDSGIHSLQLGIGVGIASNTGQ